MKSVCLVLTLVALATLFVVSPSHSQPVAPRQNKTRRVNILGEIQRSGAYELPANGTLASLILLAGGATEEAALSQVKVYRGTATFTINVLDLLKIKTVDFTLQDRDFVLVPRNENRVLVAGDVKKPGFYAIPEGQTLSVAQALERAGGAFPGGDLSSMRITRAQNKSESWSMPYSSEAVKPDQLLQNGDVLYVSRKKRAEPRLPGFQLLKSN